MSTEATTKVLMKPLNGSNYATWKVQCKMALIRDGLWNIVSESEAAPAESNDNGAVVAKFELRKDRALATIVLSMEPSLLYLLGPDPDDPAEVWKKLSNQFQKKSWANKLALRRKLYALQLKEGQSIQTHIKTMTEIFDELAIVGDPLDDENKVVHLLASLPKSFDMLVTALEASPEVPKIEVVTERILHEESKRKHAGIEHEVKAMTSKHHNKKGPQCYHCGKYGHIKRECHQLTRSHETKTDAKKKKFATRQNVYAAENKSNEEVIGLVVEHALAADVLTNWIVDSGATCHMCYEEDLFIEMTKLEEPQKITVGDGYSVEAVSKGTVELMMKVPGEEVRRCNLSEVLYVPKLSYNLLSVSKATKTDKMFQFGQSSCSIMDINNRTIATATKSGNLYYLNCARRGTATSEVAMCGKEDTKESIWHRRFGHLGVKNLERLAKDQLVEGFDYNPKKNQTLCEPCIRGKQHRTPFPNAGGERSDELLGVVHSDVCGKIEEKSLSGAEYFITFIDDKSRHVWVYMMKHKSEAFQKFLEWKAMVEKSTGLKMKTLRTDNGGEYTSSEFEKYLKSEGIKHETTIPKTPEQNGVAERMNRTLVETVRAMLADSGLAKSFWAEALSTATYLRNRSPTRAVKGMTPYEVWTRCKPDISNLRIFGCKAFAHIPKDERGKMDLKSKPCIFLGYGETTKGFRMYDETKRRVFYSRDVVFNEVKSQAGTTTIPYAEESIDELLVDVKYQPNDELDDTEQLEPERPQRGRKPPDRYGDWVYIAHEDDPKSVEEALSSGEKEKWAKAMKIEMDSLHDNNVWDIVELPKERKAIGSKWVFKRKRDADGNVERHKARLVAQGFTQKSGIDYDETFCPVVRFESIRAIIALAAKHNLRLHQVDITTAFLNGELKEDIFMKQPKGFEARGKEHMVCKLNRTIYGLKQSSRCWNQALDKHLKNMGFKSSTNDPCIYTLNSGGEVIILAVYVDDIILAGKSTEKIQQIIKEIAEKFDVKDMGELHHFLGVKITRLEDRKIWISQSTYTREILKKFNMENSKPVVTPVEAGTKLVKTTEEDEPFDQEVYQSAVGCLLYLSTKTRPDIAYAVGNVARFTSQPSMQHWSAVKRIMRYLNGTINYGMMYGKESSLTGYADANWAGDLDDRRSTSGYIFTMSGAAISWMSKKQNCVALSTAEAEYMALSSAAQESVWLERLLGEMNERSGKPIVVFEDNQSTICMAKNPKFHGRAKHIGIKHHYIREQVNNEKISLEYCPTEDMIADILTKGLGRVQFNKLRAMMGICEFSDSK